MLADPVLKNAKEINVMGFSQGGIIARFIVQECLNSGSGPIPRNLITVGTPNMGVEVFAGCEPVTQSMLF